jgi:hypothetical protein
MGDGEKIFETLTFYVKSHKNKQMEYYGLT